MSRDPDDDYLSDGLAEELINLLAHVPSLKVTARTSSFAFRGKEQDIRRIAETLGVRTSSKAVSAAELRTATRQAARGVDARPDRPTTPRPLTNSTIQGILAFAERILPRASDLWVQASLDYKQRLQQLFFPRGS